MSKELNYAHIATLANAISAVVKLLFDMTYVACLLSLIALGFIIAAIRKDNKPAPILTFKNTHFNTMTAELKQYESE